jgi:hypothetical protein
MTANENVIREGFRHGARRAGRCLVAGLAGVMPGA